MNNDKKKTMALVGLGVLLIAVGAFQFMPKPQPAPLAKKPLPAPAKSPTNGPGAQDELAKTETDPQRAMLKALVKDPRPPRDPFAPQGGPELEPPQDPGVTQKPISVPSMPRMGGSTPKPITTHEVPPFDPGPPTGSLPAGNTTIGSAAPLRLKGEMRFQVKGVIVGQKPMAVIEDDNGSQRLVPLGGSVDSDSTVVGIEKGKVKIRHKGKNKTLNLPEGP